MRTESVADRISRDLAGPGYLAEPARLARYLRGKLRLPHEAAAGAARAILGDRGGRRFYQRTAVLTGFLDRRLGRARIRAA
jgi:hypothetical protein